MLPQRRAGARHPLTWKSTAARSRNMATRFSINHQMMAAAGYARVVHESQPGSTGYGEAFANMLHDRFPVRITTT